MNINPLTIAVGLIAGIFLAIFINLFIYWLKNWLIIGTASKVGVIAGATGFSLVRVGQAGMCIPFLNKISWLEIGAMVEDIRVENVISKGGSPVSIDAMVIYGIGSAKPDEEERVVGNAIKTSLSKDRKQISKQIAEVLEGNFRETIVGMTPEELINDKKQFNDRIMAASREDLEVLGFRLYEVKIKDIWDDKGYLKTLTKKGIQKITAQMDVMQKECDADAAKREAENARQISVSTSNMKQSILEREKMLEMLRREKAGKLEEAKKVAVQKIEKTRAEGLGRIEKANIEVQRIVQRMNTSLPAEIDKRSQEILSVGVAEKTKIVGDAKNKVLQAKLALITKYGRQGLVPFLISRLQLLAGSYKESLKQVVVSQVTVLGSKEGESGYSLAANMGPSAFLKHLNNMESAFGVSVKKILSGNNEVTSKKGGEA